MTDFDTGKEGKSMKQKATKKKPIEISGDRKKALETAIAQIEKEKGKGSIMRLGENQSMNVQAVSTGSHRRCAAGQNR